MTSKPRLLVLSQVFPFPRKSGQQQRVYYTLKAAWEFFHITFVAPVGMGRTKEVREKLSAICDAVVLLPSRYSRSKVIKAWHRVAGAFYTLRTGLKLSNYVIGQLELAPSRVAQLLMSMDFDCALFEYWHAVESASIFQRQGIPCVLDMHDILWQSYARQLKAKRGLPEWWRQWAVRRYQKQEEAAWRQFDALIAINREEMRYVQTRVPPTIRLFYAPMGTDLTRWPYSWEPAQPPCLAYYGGLSSFHNQQGALRCFKNIIPIIWRQFPKAELWLVGSNPPQFLRALARDPRVHVTGYVEDVQSILRTISVVLCPWSGTYGFRSRLIEVMALGVPVVASPDAVYGMELEEGKGLFLGEDDRGLAEHTLKLLGDRQFAQKQSRLARKEVERLFSFENTYGCLMHELSEWIRERKEKGL